MQNFMSKPSHKLLTNFLFLLLDDQLNKLWIFNVKMRMTQESEVSKLHKVQG